MWTTWNFFLIVLRHDTGRGEVYIDKVHHKSTKRFT
jgi:hypothetical protein